LNLGFALAVFICICRKSLQLFGIMLLFSRMILSEKSAIMLVSIA